MANPIEKVLSDLMELHQRLSTNRDGVETALCSRLSDIDVDWSACAAGLAHMNKIAAKVKKPARKARTSDFPAKFSEFLLEIEEYHMHAERDARFEVGVCELFYETADLLQMGSGGLQLAHKTITAVQASSSLSTKVAKLAMGDFYEKLAKSYKLPETEWVSRLASEFGVVRRAIWEALSWKAFVQLYPAALIVSANFTWLMKNRKKLLTTIEQTPEHTELWMRPIRPTTFDVRFNLMPWVAPTYEQRQNMVDVIMEGAGVNSSSEDFPEDAPMPDIERIPEMSFVEYFKSTEKGLQPTEKTLAALGNPPGENEGAILENGIVVRSKAFYYQLKFSSDLLVSETPYISEKIIAKIFDLETAKIMRALFGTPSEGEILYLKERFSDLREVFKVFLLPNYFPPPDHVDRVYGKASDYDFSNGCIKGALTQWSLPVIPHETSMSSREAAVSRLIHLNFWNGRRVRDSRFPDDYFLGLTTIFGIPTQAELDTISDIDIEADGIPDDYVDSIYGRFGDLE